jgi:hypothetical protein
MDNIQWLKKKLRKLVAKQLCACFSSSNTWVWVFVVVLETVWVCDFIKCELKITILKCVIWKNDF